MQEVGGGGNRQYILVDDVFSCWGERLLFGFQLISPFSLAGPQPPHWTLKKKSNVSLKQRACSIVFDLNNWGCWKLADRKDAVYFLIL